jgi:hypothetical protein
MDFYKQISELIDTYNEMYVEHQQPMAMTKNEENHLIGFDAALRMTTLDLIDLLKESRTESLEVDLLRYTE